MGAAENKKYLANAEKSIRDEWKCADGNNKMVYLKHDFLNNYQEASRAGDGFMRNDILLTELARCVERSKNVVVDMYNKHFPDKKISRGSSADVVIKSISTGIATNKKFADDIAAYLVANCPSGDGSKMSADGSRVASANVVAGLSSLFRGPSQETIQQTNKAAEKALMAKYYAMDAAESSGSNAGAILMGILFVGFLTTTIVLLARADKK